MQEGRGQRERERGDFLVVLFQKSELMKMIEHL